MSENNVITEMKDLVNVEPLHLIDVCSEDDCLISTPGFGENQTDDDCFDLFVVGDAEENGGGKDDYFDLSEIGDPDTRNDGGNQGDATTKVPRKMKTLVININENMNRGLKTLMTHYIWCCWGVGMTINEETSLLGTASGLNWVQACMELCVGDGTLGDLFPGETIEWPQQYVTRAPGSGS